MAKQPNLFLEGFSTTEEPTPIYCHQEFLDKVQEKSRGPVGRRASLLVERLAVDPRREFYKGTLGINKGWRRSRLGGSSGSHFYAWWAPKGAPPLRNGGFETAPEGALFLRDIRHHDDHSELLPQNFEESYLPITVKDLKAQEYLPSPLTPVQTQFTVARQRVRVIKGYPGSGKTTALWHAADENSTRSTLYVTYSTELAALARTHFQRFASAHKQFQVVTFGQFLRRVTGATTAPVSVGESRTRFIKLLAGLPPRVLGPWSDVRPALYDELHAHLVGAALPIQIGRFVACEQPRLPDRAYRDQRRRALGHSAVDAALEAVNTLEKKHGPELYEQCFPELLLARNAVGALEAKEFAAKALLECDCVAVDEVQDLTPIEALVVVKLAGRIRDAKRIPPVVLMAGDEAQTVRPTDFEWGWLHDLLHYGYDTPREFELPANLRSPRRIAHITSGVWELYAAVAKGERPGGLREAEIEDESSDQVLYCVADRDASLESLLRTFADREGLAMLTFGEKAPDYVPADLASRVLTIPEAKGLDFRAVCLLEPGPQIHRILDADDRVRRDSAVVPLAKRLAIDQLRVAVSRPTDRLYLLDVRPAAQESRQMRQFLEFSLTERVAPVIPDAVLKTLDEELLTVEERVQLCQKDALQLLDVRPDMAWVRAKQAVGLVGHDDPDLRRSANLTLVRVATTLFLRRARLAPELDSPDLAAEAEDAARRAGMNELYEVLSGIFVLAGPSDEFKVRPATIITTLEAIEKAGEQVESWLGVEISKTHPEWLTIFEERATNVLDAEDVIALAPVAYKLYDVPDAAPRIVRLRQNAIAGLMQVQFYKQALALLNLDADPPAHLVAECREGLGEFATAAELYLKLGKSKDALRNYRAIPDLDRALELIREIGGQAAEESLEWARELRGLLERRPKNFARVASEAEKKWVADLLEANLGRPRSIKPVKKRGRPKDNKP